MDPQLIWHSLGGGAIIAAALTFARLLFDYSVRGIERRLERDERHSLRQRDAEARLEREHLLLIQAHELLKEQYVALQADRLRHLDGCHAAESSHDLVAVRRAGPGALRNDRGARTSAATHD